MDAEFSVELGHDDPTLAVPWRSPDGKLAYIDLRQNPEAIEMLSEVRAFPELANVLYALNAPGSIYQTAKCDVWFDTLMDIDDEPYDAEMKCASYIDVFFSGRRRLAEFAEHEASAGMVVKHLRGVEDMAARVELSVRRAYFEDDPQGEGFYWTVYVFGYGDDLEGARSHWSLAMQQTLNALLAL
jgi:hypothetical protein